VLLAPPRHSHAFAYLEQLRWVAARRLRSIRRLAQQLLHTDSTVTRAVSGCGVRCRLAHCAPPPRPPHSCAPSDLIEELKSSPLEGHDGVSEGRRRLSSSRGGESGGDASKHSASAPAQATRAVTLLLTTLHTAPLRRSQHNNSGHAHRCLRLLRVSASPIRFPVCWVVLCSLVASIQRPALFSLSGVCCTARVRQSVGAVSTSVSISARSASLAPQCPLWPDRIRWL
jgi:hypothetical protein